MNYRILFHQNRFACQDHKSYFYKAGVLNIISNLRHDKLLIETDSPYLAPVPHRGKKNEPRFIKHTLETLAHVKNIEKSENEIASE